MNVSQPESTSANSAKAANGNKREVSVTLAATLLKMQTAQRKNPAPTYEERLDALERLERTLLRNKDAICDAVSHDFGNRSRHESLVAEVFVTLQGLKYAKTHLAEWMETRHRETSWAFLPGRSEVQYQPLGVVGIISPWNYPVQLAIAPLVSVLAAGNRAMLKPSELTPRCSELLRDMMAEAFDPDHVTVITGGPEVGEAFTRLPFDHLVFTGSTKLGKLVMRAAAENLVPVTLELGGKSPAIVGEDMAIDVAARKVMLGKLFNAGQTCIAPDYVLVPEGKMAAFVEAAKTIVKDMYPTLATNPDYTSIVNARHYDRLKGYVEDATAKGARAVECNPAGETLAPELRKLAPTLLLDTTDAMDVMQDEIFGPLLPVVPYKSLAEAINFVNDRPRPLALYYFGHNEAHIDRVLKETTSGGVSINETMAHIAQDDLPFGGVGPSGMGHYHAFEGFEQFSKKKPIFRQARLNATGLLRPPYGTLVETFLKVVLGK